MGYGFSRSQRLTSARDYRRVFKFAKRKQTQGVTALFVKNEKTNPRLGLIIAKRDIPKATTRNLLKRTVRESFRLHQHHLKGYDIVIMVKRPCMSLLNSGNLVRALETLWQSLRNGDGGAP